MTTLVWDKAGERTYETGVDHGVLYLPDGTAVPWNGLVSIVDSRSRDVKSFYLDGVKYRDDVIPGDYAARLTAFTYPDELEALLGNARFAPGVTVYDQPSKTFDLSYRTLLGNDLEGVEHGYKIHVVYNVVAIPTDVTSETLSETVSAGSFEWDLKGTPVYIDGFRATNHISIDSRQVPGLALVGLEAALYGTATTDPALPAFGDLLDLVT